MTTYHPGESACQLVAAAHARNSGDDPGGTLLVQLADEAAADERRADVIQALALAAATGLLGLAQERGEDFEEWFALLREGADIWMERP